MDKGKGLLFTAAALTVSFGLFAPSGASAHPAPHSAPTPPSTSTSSLPRGVTANLNTALRDAWGGLPGGALATVIVPGKGRWVGSVGYADVERQQALTPAMQTNIGSVTKTFTGMLVLQEVAAGRLRLNDRLSRWYPSIPKSRSITIAMLLNMTSGINDYLNANIIGYARELQADPHRQYRPDDLIAAGAALPRTLDVPGSAFSYSNTNTVILARILEKTTGKRYSSLLASGLTKPLRMPRTFVNVIGRLQAPYAQSYSGVFSALDPNGPPVGLTTDWGQSVVWSAGGVASTIDDLGRWGYALGTGRGAIPASVASQRLTDCAPPVQPTPAVSVSYCLGLVVDRDTNSGQPLTLWHNGRVFGSVAYVGYYPATGAVVAVIANTDQEGPDGQHVSMRGREFIEAAVPALLGL